MTKMNYSILWKRLAPLYGEGEAKAMAQMLYEVRYGLTLADILLGRDESVAQEQMLDDMCRLEHYEPIQYVLGEATFCQRTFHVEPGVLIPRPETQWLCQYVTDFCNELSEKPCLLDIGTGSGCIACVLALETQSMGGSVEAWDISEQALSIARQNAERLGARVTFRRQDVLQAPDDRACWHAIVSNPPYVLQRERNAMEANVLNYEPATALFVPDDDPLLFYRAIAHYAIHSMKSGGLLALEINRAYGQETVQLLTETGFRQATVHQDDYDNDRFVTAYRP